jgi:alpha-L-fucosidase
MGGIVTNQQSTEQNARFPKLAGEKSWFLDAGLGIFIHFGLYSILGGNENDFHGRTPREYRDELTPQFNPQRFDADRWVEQIKSSGARYLVVTTKHGEGFCLWPTGAHDYHVGNTPFGRDIIGELAEACHRQDFRFGLYFAADNWYYAESGEFDQTVEAYSSQVSAMLDELMSNYGPICELWLDGSSSLLPPDRLGPILESCRKKQPQMVVNDRGVDRDSAGLLFGDFITPERFFPVAVDPDHEFMEICDAMGLKGWGFHREQQFHSGSGLISRFVHARSLGANYLLNVEPSPSGEIRPECVERLEAIGEWNRRHADAALHAGPNAAVPEEFFGQNRYTLGRSTQSESILFVHPHCWPRSDRVELAGVSGDIARVRLSGGSERLEAVATEAGLEIRGLPALAPESNPVIELHFDGKPTVAAAHTPPARPVLVEGVPTLVPAQHAELHTSLGGVSWHAYETYANGAQTIGRWVHASSAAHWVLEVTRGGPYTLFAALGTTEDQANATARFEAAGRSVEFTTVATGHYTEGHTHRIGTLELPEGEVRLTLFSPSVERFFPNIHYLILIPE